MSKYNEVKLDLESIDFIVADKKNLKGVPQIFHFRKCAVYYLFILFGSPEFEIWSESNMVEEIMTRLLMTKKDVYNTLENILESINEGCDVFDPSRRMKAANDGKSIIIKDINPSAHVIYKAVSNGSSITMATYTVNLHREACGQGIVSRSTE